MSYHLTVPEAETWLQLLTSVHDGQITIDDILSELRYEYHPVEIDEFIESSEYFGETLDYGKMVYPYWRRVMKEVAQSAAYEIVFTGAAGIGKTKAAAILEGYIAHRIACIKNLPKLLGKLSSTQLVLIFFNVTEDLAQDGIWGEMSNMMVESPWFRKVGEVRGNVNRYVSLEKHKITYEIASPKKRGFGWVGKTVLGGTMDEISEESEGEQYLKSKAYKMYVNLVRRIATRFEARKTMIGGFQLLRLFLVSSKKRDQAFVESYIHESKKRISDGEIAIYDGAIWDVKPEGTYGKETFPVAIGDKFKSSEVVEEGEVDAKLKMGYNIIRPPMDLKKFFLDDVDGALRELAAVSIESDRKHKLIPSAEKLKNALVRINPVKAETLQLHEVEQIADFFDFLALQGSHWVHVDLSLSQCACGIAGAKVSGAKSVSRMDSATGRIIAMNDVLIEVPFVVRIMALPNSQIQFWKIRLFLVELRKRGLLQSVTFDGFQCLSGETNVLMLDGTKKNIKDIKEGDWIYSINGKNEMVAGQVGSNTKMTGRKQIYKVGLDTGEVVKCSGNHPFMLRDGSYKIAEELREGDSLMPFYEKTGMADLREYKMVYNPCYDKFAKNKDLEVKNHKVAFVEKTNAYEEMYDFEVKEFHNFAIAQGVFVHNSADGIQLLTNAGITAGVYSVDKTDAAYISVRTALLEDRLILPRHKVLEEELENLEWYPLEKTVDHPEGGSKDVSDAVAGAVFGAMQQSGMLTTTNGYIDQLRYIVDKKQERPDKKKGMEKLLSDGAKVEKL